MLVSLDSHWRGTSLRATAAQRTQLRDCLSLEEAGGMPSGSGDGKHAEERQTAPRASQPLELASFHTLPICPPRRRDPVKWETGCVSPSLPAARPPLPARPHCATFLDSESFHWFPSALLWVQTKSSPQALQLPNSEFLPYPEPPRRPLSTQCWLSFPDLSTCCSLYPLA